MSWPTAQHYEHALRNPKTSLEDTTLHAGTAEKSPFGGLLSTWSGNFACVFKMNCGKDSWAIRCFTRDQQGRDHRYGAISQSLNGLNLPYMVHFAYQQKGVKVDGKSYPILKMEWAKGKPLVDFINDHVQDRVSMLNLADNWLEMIGDLHSAGIAHGDLQHENVLIDDGNIKLVDYDGMYVPALLGQQSTELGLPHFQHPDRNGTHFGPYLDNFSSWVIYVSLVCLAHDPSLWLKVGQGDDRSLLFKKNDFSDPKSSSMLRFLRTHGNDDVKELATLFESFIHLGTKDCPTLEESLRRSTQDLYRLFGLNRGCGLPQLQRARVIMSQIWHPDAYSINQDIKALARHKSTEIEEAFNTLKTRTHNPSSSPPPASIVEEVVAVKSNSTWFKTASSSNKPSFDPSLRPSGLDLVSDEPWSVRCRRLVAGLDPTRRIATQTAIRFPIFLATTSALVAAALTARGIVAYVDEPKAQQRLVQDITNNMVSVPASGRLVGANSSKPKAVTREAPIAPLLIAKHEVTQKEYDLIMGKNPSRFSADSNPVENVNWQDAQDFLSRLNAIQSRYRFRLPKESEWEFACAQDSVSPYFFPDKNLLPKYAWTSGNSQETTHNVGQLHPNRLGLYDIYGNVAELCEDDSSQTTAVDPSSKAKNARPIQPVIRGASWLSGLDPAELEDLSAQRRTVPQHYRSDTVGFRLVAVLAKPESTDTVADRHQASQHFAQQYFSLGRYSNAKAELDSLLSEPDPSASPSTRLERLILQMTVMDSLHYKHNDNLLAQILRERNKLPEGSPRADADFHLATSYKKAGKQIAAKPILESLLKDRTLKDDPDRPVEVRYELGIIYRQFVQYDSAIKYLNEAISLSTPKTSPALLQQVQTELADVQALKLANHRQDLKKRWNNHIAQGFVAFKNAEYKKSETAFQNALSIAKELNSPLELAASYLNIATNSHAQKRMAVSADYCKLAAEIMQANLDQTQSLRKSLTNLQSKLDLLKSQSADQTEANSEIGE